MALIGTFIVFYPTQVNEYLDAWINSHSYSHGLLLVLVSIFLIISKPYSISPSNGNIGFLLLLALLLLVYSLAYLAKIEVILRFLIPCFIITGMGAVFGYHNLKKFILPLVLLFFTVPSWSIVSPVFQSIAANAVATISLSLGIPTYIEGNSVAIPNGTFMVAEGCSGVRYILVALSIALINSELSQFKTKSFVISLSLAFILAIVANWVRIEVIILYAHQYGMSHPIIADHNNLGWIVFGIFMLAYFLLLPYITKHENREKPLNPAPLKGRQKVLAATVFGMLALGSLMPTLFVQPQATQTDISPENQTSGIYNFQRATKEQHTVIVQDDSTHHLSVLEYDMRDPQADISAYLNKPISNKYHIKDKSTQFVNNTQLDTFIITDNSKKYLYSYWYETANMSSMSMSKIKLQSVLSLLKGYFINRAYFIATECDANCDNLAKHQTFITQTMTKEP